MITVCMYCRRQIVGRDSNAKPVGHSLSDRELPPDTSHGICWPCFRISFADADASEAKQLGVPSWQI